jgi:hypothetical protein
MTLGAKVARVAFGSAGLRLLELSVAPMAPIGSVDFAPISQDVKLLVP